MSNSPPSQSFWARTRDRLTALQQQYGAYAVGTYLTLFFGVWMGFAIAIRQGWTPEGGAGDTGLLVAAWAATKVTQPVRILASVALTPLVARVGNRLRGIAAAPPAV